MIYGSINEPVNKDCREQKRLLFNRACVLRVLQLKKCLATGTQFLM